MSGNMSMKSAQIPRVDLATAQRIASERQSLGNPQFCPAAAQELFFDVYGRPATNPTLDKRDASCSNYMGRTGPTLQNYIAWENFSRPLSSSPACSAESLVGDGLAAGRDLFPRDIYGQEPGRGNFVRLMTNNSPAVRNPAEFSYMDKTIPDCECGRLANFHNPPNYFAQFPNGSMSAQSVYYKG